MKRISIVILLIVPVLCFAQNKKALNNFWDIPWGISIEQAEAVFQDRNFSTSREEDSLITQAKYEGEEASIVLLFNKLNRFYCGNVIYSSTGTTVIDKYKNYRMLLFRRYGMPDTAVEYFNSPYQKGDGREIEAIGSENAFYYTEWDFNNDCQASVSILKSLDVCLSFKNPNYADAEIVKN